MTLELPGKGWERRGSEYLLRTRFSSTVQKIEDTIRAHTDLGRYFYTLEVVHGAKRMATVVYKDTIETDDQRYGEQPFTKRQLYAKYGLLLGCELAEGTLGVDWDSALEDSLESTIDRIYPRKTHLDEGEFDQSIFDRIATNNLQRAPEIEGIRQLLHTKGFNNDQEEADGLGDGLAVIVSALMDHVEANEIETWASYPQPSFKQMADLLREHPAILDALLGNFLKRNDN